MTNSKHTKRALFSSIVSLLLCFTMLMGATFAWFTDNVSSTGNIIKSGDLEVGMYWAEGGANIDSSTVWSNAATGAIFDYQLWEPGYVQARHIKIVNEGNLALKYELHILANGVVSKLADVIDVYYVAPAEKLDRAAINTPSAPLVKLGTLSEVLNSTNTNAIVNTVTGSLLQPDETSTLTIAFKMQESAGNEYENLSIGSDFTVQLIATQEQAESDSFGPTYDADARYPAQETPSAMVSALTGSKLNVSVSTTFPNGTGESKTLDCGFKFEPTESLATVENSPYRYWHADFAVSADKDVPADSLALAGYYSAFCDGWNNGNWVALTSDTNIPANDVIRLLGDGMGGISVNYEEICTYGNDGKGFQCGIINLNDVNNGTTITVELRLYETEEPSDANGNSHNVETGNYITIGTFTHTIGGEYNTLSDGTVLFEDLDGEVTLYDTQNVNATTYTVPAGVTTLGNYSFSYNNTIEEVTLSSDVETLGRAFDSNTTIKKVVLNEGLEQIDSRAFRTTTALEEVIIPSTVKEIADNAFQKSHIKEIIIPASVETIGETAFGASKIEKVIFEGNTAIQGYAFRGCPNLREVYLYGDDVTFVPSTLNGRNSMWFCNGESNNPNTSNIDFYVKNDTVKERVLTAMGAERNNTDVYLIP
ncbi:MAG: leucine-rich repeat protein [Oscillospiraceae bacterium]|nr:leucine-rich repeat protein [Oscillospiraceae bacterium]